MYCSTKAIESGHGVQKSQSEGITLRDVFGTGKRIQSRFHMQNITNFVGHSFVCGLPNMSGFCMPDPWQSHNES